MKKVIAILMALTLAFCFAACNKGAAKPVEDEAREIAKTYTTTAVPSEKAEKAKNANDEISDDLKALKKAGAISVEKGVTYITVTVPETYVGEDATQASLDKKAGKRYTSAKLNKDGSITYKMTIKQREAMLSYIADAIDAQTEDIIEDDRFDVEKVKPNADYSRFDVYLDGNEVTFYDKLTLSGFYMYGGMYEVFTASGKDIVVNFYGDNGKLLETDNSKDGVSY